MKTRNLYFWLATACLLLPAITRATHNRAGEIIYTLSGGDTIRASIITYTKASSLQADRDSLIIHWGDGSADEVVYRSNGPIGTNGIPQGDTLIHDIKKNIYIGTHIFTTGGSYHVISVTDANRNDGIANINGGNSVAIPFYLEDTILMHGQMDNHSPILLYPPVDYATAGDTFYHNPTAYDVEADSMTFELITPMQGPGSAVPAYYLPSQVPYVAGDSITINRQNGLITWAVPQVTNVYNIAILIREYRYGVPMGSMVRDMQIIVQAGHSHHSTPMGIFADTTIASGQTLTLPYTASYTAALTDSLYATGGPLVLGSSPASFVSTPGHTASGTLTWTPGPNLYKPRQTYIMTISAQTSDALPLVTQRSYRITVVGTVAGTTADIAITPDLLRVAPIPASDRIHISTAQALSEITIYTIDGHRVWRYDDMPAPDMDIDISSLADGEYILVAKGNNHTDRTVFAICR